MKIETVSGEVLEPRRSVRGVAIGEVEFSPLAARELGRQLVGLSRDHRRLPGTLWGAAEMAAAFKVSKAAVHAWIEYEDFPAPVARLAMGRVYDADAVRRWKAGRPKVGAPAHNGRQTNKGRQA